VLIRSSCVGFEPYRAEVGAVRRGRPRRRAVDRLVADVTAALGPIDVLVLSMP
jgi:hypothetical protein